MSRERGVALVVTLILLTVITFLAVAFLFLSQRERGAVTTAVDMTAARLATEAATERAKAETLARIISTTNEFNYALRVSTNYFNPQGLRAGDTADNDFRFVTNVNFDYLINGAAVVPGSAAFVDNVANLFYDPRPPVFVDTNRLDTPANQRGALDFRFYLDLNRNGRFETNGRLPELDFNGQPILTLDTNGNNIVLSNNFVGDPEWVGILERPDRPHGPNNRFVSRMAYVLVPEGLTLDLNNIHNQSKLRTPVTEDGYYRNMGVSPFEMNLAAFLVDLNTNVWNQNDNPAMPVGLINPTAYFYDTNAAVFSRGTAFDDAVALTRYRFGGGWNQQRRIVDLFGGNGVNVFSTDFADGFGGGPLMTDTFLPLNDPDTFPVNRTGQGWPGADTRNRFVTTQDLFERNKTTGAGQMTPNTFTDRLINSGRFGDSTYDRYTYYRLLSQLGTDSGPEPAKMHLNYKNVVNGQVVPNGQTNFVSWQPLDFFTNAANAILTNVFANPSNNLRQFGINDVLSITNIPVMVSNTFVYSPAIHRVMQVAANIADASTNYTMSRSPGNPITGDLPSVFRPTFERRGLDIYISGFKEVEALVGGSSDPILSIPLDLNNPIDRANAGTQPDQNIYGVPWVIGAKKGFPNFNEFAVETISQITRKLQFIKPSINATTITQTNQMFVVGISNAFGFELWNSYANAHPREVDVLVASEMAIYLNHTNNLFGDTRSDVYFQPFNNIRSVVLTNIAAGQWQGYRNIKEPNQRSFVIPLRTNINFLPESIYRANPPSFVSIAQTNRSVGNSIIRGFETGQGFPIPEFSLSVSNRIRVVMIDKVTQRIVDIVHLNDLNTVRNLTDELTDDRPGTPTEGNQGRGDYIFWNDRRGLPGNLFSPPEGVIAQIQASLGSAFYPTDWQSYGVGQASGATKDKEIDGFRVFMGLGALKYPDTVNSSTIMQAPFTPTRRFSQHLTWQANDPLVHFNVGDLQDLRRTNAVTPLSTKITVYESLINLGRLNDRFAPWGGDPRRDPLDSSDRTKYAPEIKDPLVSVSDNWDFPTNKYPTVGWLGRVHRGTPWQTVYLKSSDVDDATWARWTGNSNRLDQARTQPVLDRVLFDVFTTAFDDNTTRGQLNVNQDGLAAWSAALSGVIGLTNVTSEVQLQNLGVRPEPPVPSIIEPAGVFLNEPTNTILGSIWAGVNRTRSAAPFRGSFQRAGDVLATPELTVQSPILNRRWNSRGQNYRLQRDIDDATYERLPQMLMGLLRGDDQPRFAIYAYGQTLKPANRSILTSGQFAGMCTNYQVTAEFATRTVVRINTFTNQLGHLEASAVTESFNILPPDE